VATDPVWDRWPARTPATGSARSGHPRRRRGGTSARQDPVHPGPAHRPPRRHGRANFPLMTETTSCPTSWPRATERSTGPGVTGATRAQSSAPATTATVKDPATTAPARPRASSADYHFEQHGSLKLRGVGLTVPLANPNRWPTIAGVVINQRELEHPGAYCFFRGSAFMVVREGGQSPPRVRVAMAMSASALW
jgi:hypothetical protein